MRVVGFMGSAAVLLVLLAGCTGSDLGGPLQKIDEKQAGDYLVLALSRTGRFSPGKSEFLLEFRRGPDRQLVDPSGVTVSLSMPMAGMAPMSGSVSVEPFDKPGRYRVKADVSMAGTWYLTIAFNDGQKVTLKLSGR